MNRSFLHCIAKACTTLLFSSAWFACTTPTPTAQELPLKAEWEFRQADQETWYPAQVPGNIHTDLLANSIIDDPFYGTNEHDVQWIEHKDWVYRTTFEANEALLNNDQIEIEFEGLDTYADVKLNGQLLFSSNNMFTAWSADIQNILIAGKNTLELYFHSPIKQALPLHQKSPYTYPADNDRSIEHLSVYTRKAPYHYGWDWGPRFVTSGIWRPVKLKVWNKVRIADVYLQQNLLTDAKAEITLKYDIQSLDTTTGKLNIAFGDALHTQHTIALKPGINHIAIPISINNPKRWWPNGMGEPFLYKVTSELTANETLADTKTIQAGLRTIEVINQPDSMGVSFYLKVNGIPTFMKGVNYIPNDAFLGRMTDSVYLANFENALASNMNMIRVWGGGVYEDDRFYELADEKGILIWQDFMFACTLYPSDSAFLANVAREAEYNIRRLRNHPSVALWCGNNEVKVGWDNWGWQQSYGYTPEQQVELLEGYRKLFLDLLPSKVAALDSGKFYYDSSPISNWGNLEDFKIADNHYWGVWWGKHEFEKMNQYIPRFMSEFGFQSFPSMETIKNFASEADFDIDSEVMKSHQKSSIGNVTIKEYMERDYRMPQNFADFVYLSQVMQAEGMRIGLEAHRRHKPYCMGTLYWQFNDVWPVVSWSGIDYYGRWKPLQYFVKKAFAPVLTSAVMENEQLKVNLISDKIKPVQVLSTLTLVTLKGEKIWSEQKNYQLEANQNKQILDTPISKLLQQTPRNQVVLVMETQYDNQRSETVFLLDKVKNLPLEKPTPEIKVVQDGLFTTITMKSPVFVKNIELLFPGFDGKWSDNYFDMVPDKTYRVTFRSTTRMSDPMHLLQVKSVRNTY